MKGFNYLEGHGLKIVPIYEGLKPIRFLVVNPKEETVAESNMLHKVEDFIMSHRKLDKGPAVDAIAELPTL